MKGIELALRFSYITNSLRFCGPKEASEQFLNYLKNKNNEEQVKKSLLRFEGLHPYLSSIAEKNNKDIFDEKVAEAYWIGNDLLDNLDDNNIKEIIKKLVQHGLPESFGEKLIQNLPSGFVPHHNFNVFYVGVGMLTSSVETNLQNMDNCRISWGKVIETSPEQEKLIVQTDSLKKENNKIIIKKDETKTVVFLKEMLNDAKKGDIVALHWGFAPLVLNEYQSGNLKRYSQKILDVMNKSSVQ